MIFRSYDENRNHMIETKEFFYIRGLRNDNAAAQWKTTDTALVTSNKASSFIPRSSCVISPETTTTFSRASGSFSFNLEKI